MNDDDQLDQNLPHHLHFDPIQLASNNFKPEDSPKERSQTQNAVQNTPRASSLQREEAPTLFNIPNAQSNP